MRADEGHVDLQHIPVCRDPVFVFGSPRSGTTVLARALAEHSQLWTSGESHILAELFGGGVDGAFQRAKDRPGQGWLQAEGVERGEFLGYLGLGMNALFTSRSGGRRWIDQTPDYVLIADLLAEMFPGALFLHMLRDGRHVVHSMQNFLGSRDQKVVDSMRQNRYVPDWSTNFAVACRTWRRYARAAQEFGSRHPGRCLTVRYEHLVADPEHGFGEMLDFVGASREDGPARYFGSTRINSSFPASTVTAPAADPWSGWSAEQRSTFWQQAGWLLTQMGMVTDTEAQRMQADVDHAVEGRSEREEQLLRHIQATVQETVPPNAGVIVALQGDDDVMLRIDRPVWRFPQPEEGRYTSYFPDSDAEAVGRLEVLRSMCGAEFILFPWTSIWWLEYYPGFRAHLDQHYQVVIHREETCAVYRLRTPVSRSTTAGFPASDSGGSQ